MSQTYEIIDASFGAFALVVGLGLTCLLPLIAVPRARNLGRFAAGAVYVAVGSSLVLSALLFWFAAGQASARIELAGSELRFDVPVYGRTVPLARIRAESLEALSLDSSARYRLAVRTNGLGIPGYLLGWFRTGNGESVLAALTDRSRVVAIPTADGFTILASVDDADGLIGAIRAAANP